MPGVDNEIHDEALRLLVELRQKYELLLKALYDKGFVVVYNEPGRPEIKERMK